MPDLDYAWSALGTWCSMGLERSAHDTAPDDVVGFARSWQPELVVWDALTYLGLIAARASGAAQVRVLFVRSTCGQVGPCG